MLFCCCWCCCCLVWSCVVCQPSNIYIAIGSDHEIPLLHIISYYIRKTFKKIRAKEEIKQRKISLTKCKKIKQHHPKQYHAYYEFFISCVSYFSTCSNVTNNIIILLLFKHNTSTFCLTLFLRYYTQSYHIFIKVFCILINNHRRIFIHHKWI